MSRRRGVFVFCEREGKAATTAAGVLALGPIHTARSHAPCNFLLPAWMPYLSYFTCVRNNVFSAKTTTPVPRMGAKADVAAEHLLSLTGENITWLCNERLSAHELASLKKHLTDSHGLGPFDDADADLRIAVLTTVESQLTSFYAARVENVNSSNSTEDTISILLPLASCQTELSHLDAAESTLATYFQRGQGESTSLADFLKQRHNNEGRNISIAYQYYWLLLRNKKFAKAEIVLDAFIPTMESMMGKDDPRTLGALRGMIEVQMAQGRFTEAGEVEKDAWERVSAMTGEYKDDETEALKAVSAAAKAVREGKVYDHADFC